jgi:iron complex outermembrane recepter protein
MSGGCQHLHLKVTAAGCVMLAAVFLGTPAFAQVKRFDIPSETASKSIPELARQAGVQIVGPGEPLRFVTTPEVKGTYDVVAALEMMLKGTDLMVSRTAEGIIMISSTKKKSVCDDNGETMRNRSKLTTTVSWLAMALAALQCAAAQSEDTEAIETVVVQGVRASLETAQDIKRNATQVVDSIIADDIGKLPDRNIAEALQRITGIQIQNNDSEGSSIAIRGLTQIRTELNGRQIFTASGTNQLNLEYIPSELLSGIDVYKNPSADLVEDQLSGTVNLKTRKPFDFSGGKYSLSMSGNYYDLADKLKPSATLLMSDRINTGIGEIGALVSFVFQKTAYRNQQVQVEPFYTLDESDATDAAIAATLGRTGQTTTLPHGAGFNDNYGPRRRIGVDVALQWRPTNNIETTFEWFHNNYKFANVGTSFFALTSEDPIYPVDGAAFTFADNGDFISGTFQDLNVSVYQFRNNNKSSNDDISLKALWNITDKLTVTGDLQYGHSDYDGGTWLVGYTSETTGTQLYLDTSGVLPVINIQLADNASTTDVSAYTNSSFMSGFYHNSGEEKAARLDAEYTFDDSILKSVKTGIRYEKRNNVNASSQWYYVSESGAATDPEVYSLDDFFRGRADVGDGFVGFNHTAMSSYKTAAAAFGVDEDPEWLPTGRSLVSLETLAGYTMAYFDTQIAGLPIDGNAGVRVVYTENSASGYYQLTPQITTSEGQQTLGDPVTTPISFAQYYLKALPSLNVRAHLTDDMQLRFAVSRNMARPTFDQLDPTLTLNEPVSTELNKYQTATGGNPYLKPMMSLNFDTSIEWYFNKSGSVTLAGFYKQIDDFIQSGLSDRSITFSDGETVLYHVTSYSNVATAKIKGFELGYQQFFDFLPGALKGLGVQANVTFVDSNAPSPAASGPVTMIPLELLSKWSYNLVGIYELNGWSARIAYNWRSTYLEEPNDSGTGNLPRYDKPYGQLDGSVGYTFNEHVALYLDCRNINDALKRNYFGILSRPRNTEMGDRRIGLTARITY